jgi:ubiquinone/menaquinone biosynthesis C-methylase UbiE
MVTLRDTVAGASVAPNMQARSIQEQAIDVHSKRAGAFAANYDELTADPYKDCFTYSRKRLAVLLDKYLPAEGRGKKLLDVGCGPGIYMGDLRSRGYDVSGVDGSDEMLALARENNPGVDARKGRVEAIPFDSASFDVVLCIEVLRYLPDARRCIQEMGRVTKPGGSCIATAMPLFNSNGYWMVNQIVSRVPVGKLVPLKQFFTTSWGLKKDFVDAGFKDISIHGVYTGPVNWVNRLLPSRVGGFLRAWEPVDAKISDLPGARELANMFLIHAVRG